MSWDLAKSTLPTVLVIGIIGALLVGNVNSQVDLFLANQKLTLVTHKEDIISEVDASRKAELAQLVLKIDEVYKIVKQSEAEKAPFKGEYYEALRRAMAGVIDMPPYSDLQHDVREFSR